VTDDLHGLPPQAFEKIDGAPDDLFYAQPRFVTHIDEPAIAAVTQLYRDVFPLGGTILDLMGSWVAHLPPEIEYGQVIGHGMSAAELEANPRYHRWFVRNLNENQVLPFEDGTVDAVGLCVSVQYLQQPVAVFREVRRILKPTGLIAITFSNRCFPTKAVAIWRMLEMGRHGELVELYLLRAGFSSVDRRTLIPDGRDQDPLWAVVGRR
jgi:SAM-dependent methyltransferase